MGKLNLANISAGLESVKAITENLDTLAHNESIPAELILPAEDNPYAQNDSEESLKALAQNIQANGLIHPLVVNRISDQEYRLISGERRYNAITMFLNWERISCMVYDHISPNSAALKLHAANLEVREYTTEQKLRFYEETDRLLRDMKESGEYTGPIQKGIAELLGVSDRQVRKYKAIVENLPESIKEAVAQGKLNINEAAKIAAQPHSDLSEEILTDQKSGTSSAFSSDLPAENTETGTGSGFSENDTSQQPLNKEPSKDESDIDHQYWDKKILEAFQQHYGVKELYIYYLFEVPTTLEAIKDMLKPRYGYSGRTVDYSDGIRGDVDARPQKITVESSRKNIDLTYSQVDAFIRESIRNGTWISQNDAKTAILNKFKGKRDL
ncbi:Nucleoid occlusion protein [Caprobacter fermentans]|uniref:Nucleoid occlusion protein n=1 Tax=Caproicibacter fermentans TaxID=2576756 RepID=A0A6N8HYP5_9FIRM|nr:ParB/RepB/Spo0J family partition protein [Caproicibacter fermentans]MVB10453.1 Nucleoid occlusion protein [Caproicibacter fermentans]